MSARIIETNAEPFVVSPVDPVTLDIIENALRNARVEMDATLFRSSTVNRRRWACASSVRVSDL